MLPIVIAAKCLGVFRYGVDTAQAVTFTTYTAIFQAAASSTILEDFNDESVQIFSHNFSENFDDFVASNMKSRIRA